MMSTMNSNIVKKIYIVWMIIAGIMVVSGVYLCGINNIENLSVAHAKSVAIDAMGMLVSGILLFGLFREEKLDKQNNSMFRMLFALIVLFFLDAISSYIEGNSEYILAVKIVNTCVFLFEDILVYAYWTYIRDELKLSGRFLNIANKICFTVFLVNVALDLINIKLGMFFTVSSSGEYVDEPLEFVGDIAIVAIFLLAVVSILRLKEKSINEKTVLMSFEIFPIIAYFMGMIRQEYTWVYPAYMFSILLIYIRIFSKRGKKIAEQEVMLTKQNTALMISQIQPHFLYNVLTTISNLCVTDPEEAEETTVLFSQYLRTNLDSLRNQEPVSFATELGHIKTYVELEKKRFGDLLNVEYDINEQNFKVPSLGLQPIVENSIKHGIRGKNAPGLIKIGSYSVPEGYKIIIEDDGIGFDMNMPPKEDGRSHVGMINVKERLKQMCNASMEIESSPGKGCRTEIIIPR
ncbi:MAG: histidine kinase [Lachnospiraceae bacterium]|nr:histidine kinase [Lachnospiraceae bacterium]